MRFFVSVLFLLQSLFSAEYIEQKDINNFYNKNKNTFTELIKTYANTDIEYPHLKEVTLAMMILESGRGASDLSKKHLNFAGMKYRDEMKEFANKIKYRANDGFDIYCKFKSIDKFIEGFWVFLDRKPYKGWRNNTNSAQSFIKKIGPIYSPANKNYAQHVISLIPEARYLLNKYDQRKFNIAMVE